MINGCRGCQRTFTRKPEHLSQAFADSQHYFAADGWTSSFTGKIGKDTGHFFNRANIRCSWVVRLIEDSPQQAAGNLHRKDENRFPVLSLTPPQAAGNALAIAVQGWENGSD
jgi:hypothetical protein